MSRKATSIGLALGLLLCLGFIWPESQTAPKPTREKQVSDVLDSWHQAAAEANETAYFGLMTEDAVFLGTDAKERWDKKAFQAYAHPHFAKGNGWAFRPKNRHVQFSASGKTAWFDEMLDSDHLGTCRGSGVLVFERTWKIAHYHLTYPVPNELIKEVIAMSEKQEK